MRFRNVTSDNDWTFGKGKQSYVIDEEALKLNLKTRINSFLNDCFFAVDEGIDWFNLLGSKDREALVSSIRKVILETDGVLRINTVDLFFDRGLRKTVLTYDIDTQYTSNLEGTQEVIA